MKNLYKLIKPLTLLVLLAIGFAANAQQVSNGPVNLQIKADAFWKGNYDDVLDNTEERNKVWFRDAANLDGADWVGGTCFQWIGPSSGGGFPLWSGPTNFGPSLNYTYGVNVPQFFQVQLEGWEEDSGNNCLFDCGTFLGICVDGDDNHCGPQQVGGDIDFRNQGPPCVWNQTEIVGQGGGNCGNYGVRFSSYYTPAVPTVSGPTSGCGSVTVTAAGATYGGSYNWYNAPSGGSLLLANSSSYTVNTPGTYTVYAQVDNACSSLGRGAYTFTVNPVQSAAYSYSAASYCKNGTNPLPTISGTPGGAFTSAPAGLSINPTTGQINLAGSTAGTYTVTYTTTGACPGTQNQTVTIVNADNATFSYSGPSLCQGTGTVTPFIVLNGGTFSSTPAGLSITPSNGVVNLNTSNPDTYTITYNTAGACPATSTQQLTVAPSENATFSYTSAVYCQDGTNPQPIVTGTAGGTFSSTPSGLTLNNLNGTITLNSSTTGIPYTITYTTPGTCSATQTFGVTLVDNPSAPVAVSPADICEGQPIPQLSAAGTGGTINWYDAALGGSLLQSNSSIFTPTITTPGTYTYYAEEVGPATCASTRTPVSVVVNAVPAAPAVAQPASICIGDNPPTLSASGTNVQFNWYNAAVGGSLLQGNSSNYVPTISTPGTYTYYVEAVGTGSCTSSLRSAVTLVVNSLPLVAIATSDFTLCANDNAVPIFGFPAGGNFSGGGVFGSLFDPANAPLGTSNVSYTYTDGNGCSNTQSQQFIVYDVPAPLVTTNGSTVLCNGGDVTLDAGSGYVSYNWAPSNENTQTITVSTSGLYTVTVVSTDGCVGVGSNPVTVSLVPDTFVAAPIIGDVATFCLGTSINTTLDAGEGYTSYTWNPGSVPTQTLNVTAPGTYVITVQNALGCVFVDSVDVGFSNVSADIIANGPLLFCLGDSVNLTVNPAYSYIWSSGSTTQDIQVTQAGTYAVLVEDEFGCQATDTVEVAVDFPPVADFNYGQLSNSLDMNFYDFSMNGTTYSWNFGDNSSGSTVPNPTHSFPNPGDYTVILTVTNSCGEDTYTLVVPVKTVGLPELDIEKFTVYPNPTDGVLQVRFNSTSSQAIDIRVMNMVGQQLIGDSMNNFSGAFQKSYDLSSLPSGVYLFQIATEKGSRTERVIVQR
jgi:PKD repeat protein